MKARRIWHLQIYWSRALISHFSPCLRWCKVTSVHRIPSNEPGNQRNKKKPNKQSNVMYAQPDRQLWTIEKLLNERPSVRVGLSLTTGSRQSSSSSRRYRRRRRSSLTLANQSGRAHKSTHVFSADAPSTRRFHASARVYSADHFNVSPWNEWLRLHFFVSHASKPQMCAPLSDPHEVF